MRYVKQMITPLGIMRCVFDSATLYYLQFEDRVNEVIFTKYFSDAKVTNDIHEFHQQIQMQLDEYFVGERQYFDLNLRLEGTVFQKKVWQALMTINYGQVVSYQEIGRLIQHPHSMRAIGNANGANPIALIIPCHRIIRSDGTIGGYAGGIGRKEFLLNLERQKICKNK